MTTAGVDYSYCSRMVFEEIAVLATQEYLDTKRSAAARPVARPFAAPPPPPPPPPPPMSLDPLLPLVQSLEELETNHFSAARPVAHGLAD